MMNQIFRRIAPISVAGMAFAGAALVATSVAAGPARGARPGEPPPGFTSGVAQVNGTSLHYVRGGRGPAVILLHGFPEDWAEYQAIMPRLAERFSVVAVDLPGYGGSAPVASYEAANVAACIHGLAQALNLERPYVVGHDHGAIVTYAYVRRFPDALRGAMILDVPVPGLAGAQQAGAGFWHIGFIQAPGELAEKLVIGRQEAFLGWFFDLGKFTAEERAYYTTAYGAPQLHAAFEFYRALRNDAEWNAAQTAPNSVPVVVAVGEKSFFSGFLATFVEGYRAKGMTHVEGAKIPDSGHYLLADNPAAVADLIEHHAASDAK